jgi:hypothetical protein
MSAALCEMTQNGLSALSFVLRGLARLAERCDTLEEEVQTRMREMVLAGCGDLTSFARYLSHPAQIDLPLAQIASRFKLTPVETLAVRLAVAAEQDLLVGHLLAHLQPPLALSRPTIGLVAQAYAPDDVHRSVHALGQGGAVRCGLLVLCGEDRPLPERQLRIPLATALALQRMDSAWPGTSPLTGDQPPLRMGETADSRMAALASRLKPGGAPAPVLAIRCGDPFEARAAASQIATRLGLRAVLVPADQQTGMAPWLVLNGLLPVFSQWLSPGERRAVPVIAGFDGPSIVLTGPEGEFEADERSLLDWRIATPSRVERAALWRAALRDPSADDAAPAQRLASEHRHAAGRIALLAAKAHEEAAARGASVVAYDDVRVVSRRGDSVGLGAMAELIADDVDDEALVVCGTLRDELDSLVVRCRRREHFPDALGPSLRARYRPSVRALFVGLSGTGKTLAVAWLATRLGIPLFRVDLSAITSKYIGETEKNLSQLLARAEQNEVLLLFDEADSLFGKRTDIHDSNDRFANAQTNYLLQRMESYDGITVLTSNGRSRFDDAFSRRFDAIVSFPLPGAQQRRELWLAHLGPDHDVSTAQLNQLAAAAELTGGQIRNAVLRAAVAAAQMGSNIRHRHLLTGVASEYGKLSRQLPNELRLAQATAMI